MSKYLLITLLLILSKLAYTQITPKTINKTIGYTLKAPKKYDNKTGFVPEKDPIDFLQYIGLDLYLPKIENISQELDRNENWKDDKQKNITLLKNDISTWVRKELKIDENYDDDNSEISNCKDSSYLKKIYKSLPYRFSVYPCWKNISFSDYDSIADKYYTILDIRYSCRRNAEGRVMNLYDLAFKLLNKTTNDTVVYLPDIEHDESNNTFQISNTPFILVPYFTSLQKKYDNTKLIFISDENTHFGFDEKLKDINTDKIFNLKNKSIVTGKIELIKLKDVFGGNENKFFGIFLSLKTESGNTFCLYVNEDGSFSYLDASVYMIVNTNEEQKKGFFIYKDFLDKQKLNQKQLADEKKRIKDNEQRKYQIKLTELKTKFGDRLADLIITQKVEIGMTKEMCLAAWGEPIDKSKTIRQDADVETWTYSFKSRLIFKTGLLLEINQ